MEDKDIKISIMIPVYNTSKYLEKCLKSITNQSLKEIEIICVNDGSTDNSLEILKRFQNQDKRIIIINKENGGLTSARNAALKIAKGEYSLNIDSDDWIEQGYLSKIYYKAKAEELDMLITDINYCYEMAEGKYNYRIEKDLLMNNDKVFNGKEYLKNFFENNFLGYTWNKLIRTELYKQNNLKYNEKIFLFEDVELILRISYLCKKIGKLNEAFYCYRQGENNGVSKIKLKNLTDMTICFNSLIDFYQNKEEWILKELIQIKKLFYTSEILSNKYDNFDEYNNILLDYFNYIKNEKFITEKFTSKNKRLFGKNERLFLCFSYNLIKILPLKLLVKALQKLRNILSR
ncbi:glycosyltransferase family 2 protein [uncultured Fusobacterium sp.]|uniref:glycosyltransferase family 2 protein n=1 Tax=uncultured Fusobacterium sp. TaxID=159267 RepID=UPI0025F1BBA2|nr:glycosyltransferase family 2 protein [uncultured Fusobacterium sp.]